MRAVLFGADSVMIGSESFAREVMHNLDAPREAFTVVPGGTDVGRFTPRDGSNPGALRDPPTLLYHGRVDVRKGLVELLDAFRMLVNNARDLKPGRQRHRPRRGTRRGAV